jgi:hypothetical protein
MSARREILSSLAERTEPTSQVGVLAPVLFTGQEVALNTAAALSVRPAKTQRWAMMTTVVLAALHRTVLTLTPEKRPPRRYYSRRHEFLENAAMAREMERL